MWKPSAFFCFVVAVNVAVNVIVVVLVVDARESGESGATGGGGARERHRRVLGEHGADGGERRAEAVAGWGDPAGLG